MTAIKFSYILIKKVRKGNSYMKITDKGQVTIPVMIRRKFGLTPNVEIEFVADQDGVRIRKRSTGSANPFKKLRGAPQKRLNVDRYIENIRSR